MGFHFLHKRVVIYKVIL